MTEEAVVETGGSHLLDQGEGAVEAPSESPALPEGEQGAPSSAGNDWFFADGVKGEGDRPEWLKGKYKTMADQAKAYNELEKKLGEVRGAPKDGYDLDSIEGLDKDDPMLQHFSETFKDLNLSQDGFERILKEFNEVQMNMVQGSMEEEVKKLGPNAKQELNQLNNWVNNTFDEQTAGTIRNWVASADDVKALQSLRAFQPKSSIPSQADVMSVASYESSKEVQNEMQNNWKRYNEDANYRGALRQRLADSVRREKQGKK